ncbi:MAG: glycine--tRNA ligase [Dehalococcoidia bacterium]|nr:glycine--tRNA ligase [Dehalococcoidia bacterium]MDW8119072.1 glycine--tRNA ligase [Chloroflexota bacterium]
MEKIVSLCKRRGIIFPSSEIYGGLGSTWDYGPLGVELKRAIKDLWWRDNVLKRDDMVGLDAAILMHPRVWEASGHLESFVDPLAECKACHTRWRPSDLADPQRCPDCGGPLTEPRMFNLMFKTFMGPVEDSAHVVYLRPETAQGIFVNFLNVLNATRKRLPFGIAQIGKAFRNEITPGNFTFRTREFEQMEIEYFVKPGEDEVWHRRWVEERYNWYLRYGIRRENLRLREHAQGELAHYAKATVDIEYRFPWGWAELEGIANRTDFDLQRHSQFSGERLTYFDEETKQHLVPYIIEPSGGVDRAALAFLIDAYTEEPDKDEVRVVLRLHPALAPIKVAVLPLSRNERLVPLARQIYVSLKGLGRWTVAYDDAQSIGRRYRRFDEIGTPYCITIDFQSLEDQQVTIRDRDSMAQVRLPIADLEKHLEERLRLP